VNEPKFKIGQTVEWRPDQYEIRDKRRMPKTMVVAGMVYAYGVREWTYNFEGMSCYRDCREHRLQEAGGPW